MSLAEAAQPLYALPLDEFTAARNSAAKSVDDKQLAKQLRALPKPSAAAWAINMLVQHRGDELDEALGLGELLRQAQDNLDHDELVKLLDQRRELVAALGRQARDEAARLGHEVSASTVREVEQTLQAAMTDEHAADALRSGRLLRPLASIGLEPVDLTDAVAAPGEAAPRTPRKSSKPRGPSKKQVADARRAVEEAERDAKAAELEANEADARAAELGERRENLAAQQKDLQQQLADVESAMAFAEREGRALDRDRERAADEVAKARRQAERAAERLERLGEG